MEIPMASGVGKVEEYVGNNREHNSREQFFKIKIAKVPGLPWVSVKIETF